MLELVRFQRVSSSWRKSFEVMMYKKISYLLHHLQELSVFTPQTNGQMLW